MATSGTLDVSVVIPTRGRWPLLEEALASALAQEDVTLEVLVVDDASSDGTAHELARLDDGRVRVFRRTHSEGLAAARNVALAEARGTWLAFLDDDDLWAPTNLRLKLDALQRDDADAAYGGVLVVDRQRAPVYLFDVPDPAQILPRLLEANVIPGGPSGVVARTRLVRDLGGFDQRFAVMEDWDLFIRLAHAGRFAACEETVVALRKHDSNMSGDAGVDARTALRLLVEKHAALYRELGVSVDARRVDRWRSVERRRQLIAQAQGADRLRAALLYLRAARGSRRLDDAAHAVRALLRTDARATDRPAAIDAPGWLVSPGRRASTTD